ncbi:hypothetical protein JCM10908_007008 [Rhodotorula pacifica]|uniref:uncharacterized protein n=1 Tax=Rhodotorula pacifica TaxID=1495444 RepID=UPI0031804F74
MDHILTSGDTYPMGRLAEQKSGETAMTKQTSEPPSEPHRAPKGLLRQQTSLLLAQLSDTELTGAGGDGGKTRGNSVRSKTQARDPILGTTFLSRQSAAVGGPGSRLSPPAATQEEDASLRIEYDDSEQAAARAQILKSLSEGTPDALSSVTAAAPISRPRASTRIRGARAT